MFINDYRSIFQDIPSDLFGSFLVDKTTKPADIDILSVGHRVFHNTKKCFNSYLDIGLVDARLFCYLCDYLCFCHFKIKV